MFMTLYRARLKCLLRDRVNLFWTVMFPIILSTLFYFGMGGILNADFSFAPVSVAVVDDEAYRADTAFQQVLTGVSTGDDRMMDLTVTTAEQAETALRDGDITGIITVGNPIRLTVQSSGLNESILKAFLDEYQQTTATVQTISQTNPEALRQGLLDAVAARTGYTKRTPLNDNTASGILTYFYALIAMACMYGTFWGLRNSNDIQADISAVGARRSIAPTHKLQAVFSDLLASLTVHFAGLLLLLGYMSFALRVDFGDRIGLLILTCLVGSFTGISIGTLIGSALSKKEGLKYSVSIMFSMVASFLSGLMINSIRGMIARNVPILSYINPAALIVDAFYSLLVYDTLNRYFVNISILFGISLLFAFLSYLIVRRQRYASI